MKESLSPELQKLLQRAGHAREQGNLKQAHRLYSKALGKAPENIRLLYELGTLEAESGDITRAIKHLEQAIHLEPGNAVLHYALGITCNKNQDFVRAAHAYQSALEIQPDFSAASFNLGNLYARNHQDDEAISAYKMTLNHNPDHEQSLINLATLLTKQHKWDEIITITTSVLNKIPHSIHASLVLADAFRRKGEHPEAIRLYQTAISIQPDNFDAQRGLGTCYIETGSPELAISHFKNALSVQPDHTETLLLAGSACHAANDYPLATRYYRQVLRKKQDYLPALINLAEILEKQRNTAEAAELARQALKIDPGNAMASKITATILRSRGQHEQALQLMKQVDIPEDQPAIAQSIHYELGKLFDLTRETDQAFTHFSRCKQHIKALSPQHDADRKKNIETIENLTSFFLQPQSFISDASENARQETCFIIGFPRSGTTLLDQILDSHPDIEVIEERPALSNTRTLLNEMTGTEYPASINRINEKNIKILQERYFSELNSFATGKRHSQLVDKLPLNIIHTGLINRLFPQAKIILALRHPCDACLSCFMQPFEHNEAMANFYTLEDAVHYYSRVMSLWTLYTEKLDLNIHAIRYEDLIKDFRSETEKLVEFLDLPWNDSMIAYNEHARARNIRTPSYNQVTRPIYQEAKYRWERYHRHFEPYLEILSPSIKMFGYDA